MNRCFWLALALGALVLAGAAASSVLMPASVAAETIPTDGALARTGGGAQQMLEVPARAEISSPGAGTALAEGIDLDVTYINRSRLYQAYCVDYPWDIPGQPGIPFLCPGTEDDPRWPETGEMVTFTAHIINKGAASSPAFDYAWHIDGTEVAVGTLPALAPAEEITATYQWPWGHELSPDGQRALGDHSVRFTTDPANAGLATVPLLMMWAVKVTISPVSGQRRSFSVPGHRKGMPGMPGTSPE